MQLYASWTVVGIVTELREFKSDRNKTWRGYSIRVASLGATFELTADAQQYSQIAVGQHLSFTGKFEESGGRQRLIITAIDEPIEEAA